MPDRLRWILTDEDTGNSYVLTRDPKGWDELQLTHNRSEEYHGIFYDFSLEVAFSCKGSGKEFIDAIYDTKGTEGNVSILLEYKCPPNDWVTIFDGKLNYSTYKQEFRGKVLYTVIDIIQKGITQVIKTREDTDVDLLSETSIGGTTLTPYTYAPYDLNMHSLLVHIEGEFEYIDHSCCLRFETTGPRELIFIPAIDVIIDDFEKSSPTNPSCAERVIFSGFIPSAPSIIDTAENVWITQENTVTVNWDVSGTITIAAKVLSIPPVDPCDDAVCGTGATGVGFADGISARLRLFYGKDTATSLEDACPAGVIEDTTLFFIDLVTIPTFLLSSATTIKAFSGTGTQSFSIQPGYKIWTYWVIDINQRQAEDWVVTFEYTNRELTIESDTISESTFAKGVAIHEGWSRVCEGITDQTLAFKSEFFGRTNSQGLAYAFNGYGSFTAITDGLRIRNFEQTSTPTGGKETKKGITTNLKDIFNSFEG